MQIYQIIHFSKKKSLPPPRYKISNVVNQPSGRWQVSLESDAISRALHHSPRLEIQALSQPCWEEVNVVEPTQNFHPCHHGQHLWAHLANSRMAKERGKGGGEGMWREWWWWWFLSLFWSGCSLEDINVRHRGLHALCSPQKYIHITLPQNFWSYSLLAID